MAMGFDNDRIRVVRRFCNKTCVETIDGCTYRFDSEFERDWARYLEMLRKQGLVTDWLHHPTKWDFWQFKKPNGDQLYRNKPYEYTPDFLVIEKGGNYVYQELKGVIETKDISRMSRANKHYNAVFDLVLQRLPKKGKGTQIIARASQYAYVRRVIDASAIFKQVRGMI